MADSKRSADRLEATPGKQKRGALTRKKLLASARKIFARDGFENARLEEIAAKAGRTRGAFYANFKDKEDLFCAIFEENVNLDFVALAPRLHDLPSVERRIDALCEYLGEVSKDRERILLNLEFKLYAIRHPRKRKRLAKLYSTVCLQSSIPELRQLLPQLDSGQQSGQLVDTLAIGGIMDGLAISHLFDPATFHSEEVTRYLNLCLRETLQDRGTKER